jgi:hypothetical protein
VVKSKECKNFLEDIQMKKLIFGLALVFSVIPCQARIITVDDHGPASFNNIQAAIDDSNDGDVIIVKPGTYTGDGNRDINFWGKAITLRSKNGPENCIIDCQGSEAQPHRGFFFIIGKILTRSWMALPLQMDMIQCVAAELCAVQEVLQSEIVSSPITGPGMTVAEFCAV